jgi:NAD(P)-dependent dehydrogenase (short-subunit alcohol dehydrogenase family)
MTKVIVLTGVTRGLGRAMVPLLASQGHTVLGCGRGEQQLADLRFMFHAPHDFAPVDVTQFDSVQRWANRLLRNYGPPDLLINNAAVINTVAPLWTIDPAEFRHLMNVNVIGVFNVLKAFVPAMVQRNEGVIVNLSSGWGRSTSPNVAPYCASKYAIEGLTLALAQELPGGMAAIPLNPGVIDTDMLRQCWGDQADLYQKPEAWAQRAVPFMLNLGPKDNGQSLTVK